MKRKWMLVLAVSLLAVLFVTACGKDGGVDSTGGVAFDENAQACAKGKNPAEVLVLKVGDQEIYLNEVNFYAISFLKNVDLSQLGSIDSPYNSQYATVNDALKAQVLVQMRQTKILYAHAMEMGITLDEKESEEALKNAETYIGASDMNQLARFGIDRDLIVRLYEQYAIITKMENTIKEEAEKSEDSFGSYENMVFLKLEIDEEGAPVVGDDGGYKFLSESEQAELKTKAEEALEKAKNGESFDTLITEYGLESTSGVNYDLTENIEKNYGLKDGEISDIIENEYGYLIVKIIKLKDEEYSDSANEYASTSAAEEALQTKEQELFNSFEINDEEDIETDVWEKFTFQDLIEFSE